MKNIRIAFIVTAAALIFGAGCGRGKKPKVTELQRKEALHLATEADFAITMRDFARAEPLLTKIVSLSPDTGPYWVNLGLVRMKLGQRAPAKEAYQGALKAYEDEGEKGEAGPWLKQIYVLALLGRVDEARARLEKTAKRFPDNREVRAFVERKELDRLLADAKFKETAL